MSRLNINTTHLQCVHYTIYIQKLNNPTTDSVDCLHLPPIWFQGNNLYFSTTFNIVLTTCFFKTFANIFLKAISL